MCLPFTHAPYPKSVKRGKDTMEKEFLVVIYTYMFVLFCFVLFSSVGGVPRMGRIGKLIGFAN